MDQDDLYYYQRDELERLLKSLSVRHEPLVVQEKMLLPPESVDRLLAKIRQREHFSRREREAMIAAGFSVELIFPGL